MALRLASSSLARRLLNNRVVTAYTNLAAEKVAHSNGVCVVHENGRRVINAAATMNRQFNYRFMATSAAREQKDDDDDDDETDIDLEVQEANERCSGHVHIKKVNLDQWGVFTSRPYTQGSVVVSSNLLPTSSNLVNESNPSTTSCSHSIQTNWSEHILMDLPARFLNHSCEPNLSVAKDLNEQQSYDFIALRDINMGEEVRFDYETTEYEVGAFEDCACGVDSCRGTIKGFKHNKDVILAKYDEKNIAGYLTNDGEVN